MLDNTLLLILLVHFQLQSRLKQRTGTHSVDIGIFDLHRSIVIQNIEVWPHEIDFIFDIPKLGSPNRCMKHTCDWNSKCEFCTYFHVQTPNFNILFQTAPSGCLQYHPNPSGIIRSFNYAPSANSMPNSVGVEGSRQIANLNYGICVAAQSGSCSVTYSPLSSDPYSFTITGDVAGVDPALLGTSTVQNQMCNTDYVIIAAPSQTGTPLTNGSDRFCGLGLRPTTSKLLYQIYFYWQNLLFWRIEQKKQQKAKNMFFPFDFSIHVFFLSNFQVMWNHMFCMLLLMETKPWIAVIEVLLWPTPKIHVRSFCNKIKWFTNKVLIKQLKYWIGVFPAIFAIFFLHFLFSSF